MSLGERVSTVWGSGHVCMVQILQLGTPALIDLPAYVRLAMQYKFPFLRVSFIGQVWVVREAE